jgi:hypothetical protein
MLRGLIEKIVSEQQGRKTTFGEQLYYPVDIQLTNGNILLRAFRILSFENDKIKGITWKEQYSAPRENRKEVYSFFALEEIASLSCYELGIEYEKETSRSF